MIEKLLNILLTIVSLLEQKRTSIRRMEELLFGMKEKKRCKDEAKNRAEDGRSEDDGSSHEIEAFNTKTARARAVAMTSRLESELKQLYENAPKDPEGLVFGIKDSFKNGFAAACKEAKIEGLRFHDLRHTAITRMVEAGMQPAEVMRASGHTTPAMLWRYMNANVDTARRAADALDALRNSKPQRRKSGKS